MFLCTQLLLWGELLLWESIRHLRKQSEPSAQLVERTTTWALSATKMTQLCKTLWRTS